MKHTWTCGNFGLGNAYGVQEFVPTETQNTIIEIQTFSQNYNYFEKQLVRETTVNHYIQADLRMCKLIM